MTHKETAMWSGCLRGIWHHADCTKAWHPGVELLAIMPWSASETASSVQAYHSALISDRMAFIHTGCLTFRSRIAILKSSWAWQQWAFLDCKWWCSKTRGIGAGRKLKNHRRAQLWADKDYKKSHLGNEWKKPFQGASHAKGIVLEKMWALPSFIFSHPPSGWCVSIGSTCVQHWPFLKS